MSQTAGSAFPICAIGVIGAGDAGREFAWQCVRAGYTVYLEDVMPARLRRAREELQHRANEGLAGTLELVNTVEDAVRSADLVVDFVPDELESKLEILSMVDRMAPPRTILCTPTRTLSIADLASCVYRPDRCVAVRELAGPEVSVITHPTLCPSVLASIHVFLERVGRVVVYETDRAAPMLTRNAVLG